MLHCDVYIVAFVEEEKEKVIPTAQPGIPQK